ncbi:MAG: hypothetical protein B7X08_06715 [Acidocella sp. 20-63-7]|nr:MAG: hypothetical protein B7X08_06715 [Acidocella sp. 20-63-7]HQT47849.1 hypothetical protein [Acidocella sp.]
MRKLVALVLVLALFRPAFAESETATLDNHTLQLSGTHGDFILRLDGRVLFHDVGDDAVSIVGIYSSGPGGTVLSLSSGGSVSSETSSTGDISNGFSAALLEEDTGSETCPVKYQAVILGATTIVSKPFGACAHAVQVTQDHGVLVVVTEDASGNHEEVDTISATGVTAEISATD